MSDRKALSIDSEVLTENQWQLIASMCELLSFSFTYPTKELVESLVHQEYVEAVGELVSLSGLQLTQENIKTLASYAHADQDRLLHTLRAEATRLFIGAPKPLVSPFEGVWRAKEEGVDALLFVNPHTLAVERFMKSCGVAHAENKNEPVDFVATELEFMEYLAGVNAGIIETDERVLAPQQGWAAAYQEFLVEHARAWMPQFAASLSLETREPFYKVAAELLVQFIDR